MRSPIANTTISWLEVMGGLGRAMSMPAPPQDSELTAVHV